MPEILIGILRQAQDNRGCKAFSNLSLGLCGGLLAASTARAWGRGGLDGSSSVWLIAGLAPGFGAWGALGFLVP